VLNLSIAPKDTAEVHVKHPGTLLPLATITLTGPNHPATLARKRDIDTARLDPSYKPDFTAEIQATLCARTIGWKGVKDAEGKDVDFAPELLPDLYKQDWLRDQMLEGVGRNELFFKP